MTSPPQMKYCTKCVYPAASAAPLAFDENGVCSGCRVAGQKVRIDWDERAEELREIFEQYRSKDGSNYDCLIPVSGGKDSHFQTYYVTEVLGLRPLLVTYTATTGCRSACATCATCASASAAITSSSPQRRGAEEDQPPVLPDDGRHELARPLRHLHLPGPGRGEGTRFR